MKPRLVVLLVFLLFLALARPGYAARCLRGPYLQNAVSGQVDLRWELDRLGPSSVQFAADGETARKVDCEFQGRKHRARLTGLRPGTTYRYSIWFRDERASSDYSFRAVAGPEQSFSFAVMGDFGQGTAGQMGVARLLERSDTDFVLLAGDMIYGRGEEEHYDLRFFEPYRRSLRNKVFWPALGNHDVGAKDGAAALAVFDVPLNGPAGLQGGRNYSFDWGNAHFVSLDSNASRATLQRVIGPWLERDLAASQQVWKFVFFHHPPYSSAAHGEDLKMKEVMVPFFTRAKVDIVFAGHDHAYERTRPLDGVTYVVSGNGGAGLYAHRHPHDYSAVFFNQKHGLTELRIEGRHLVLRHKAVGRGEVDRFELRKP